jgi:hypothetical protein
MNNRPIRRNDGIIDRDFYRRRAELLRRLTTNRIARRLWQAGVPFAGAAAILAGYATALHLMFGATAAAEVPAAIAVPGGILVTTVHAVGAQIYECKTDGAGKLVWQFREPIATLFVDGKTVGRHYAGPNWEFADGSAVTGKAAAQAPGATADDIPLLKLDVTSSRGTGLLSGVTTVQRLNTQGGFTNKTCNSLHTFLSVPYSADYAFFKKAPEQTQQSH